MSRTLRQALLAGAAGIIVALHLLFFWRLYTPQTAPTLSDHAALQCGHWAILRVAQLHGLLLTTTEVGRRLPRNQQGHSLLQLKQCLEELGLEVTGVRESLDDLIRRGEPAILHLNEPEHFVVLARASPQQLLLFDAQGQRLRLSRDRVLPRYTGRALVISRAEGQALRYLQEQHQAGTPLVQFDALYLDRGDISILEWEVEYRFPFKNAGDAPLEIIEKAGDCTCLRVTGPNRLAAGESGTLVATFTHVPTQHPEGFTHEILVTTNDPVQPRLILVAAGKTATDLFVMPQRIDWGTVLPGESRLQQVRVYYNGEDADLLSRVQLDCTLPGVKLKALSRSEYYAENPLRVRGLSEINEFPGELLVIQLTWSPTAEPAGPVSGQLSIRPEDPGFRTLVVSLQGVVGAAVSAP